MPRVTQNCDCMSVHLVLEIFLFTILGYTIIMYFFWIRVYISTSRVHSTRIVIVKELSQIMIRCYIWLTLYISRYRGPAAVGPFRWRRVAALRCRNGTDTLPTSEAPLTERVVNRGHFLSLPSVYIYHE